MSNQLEALKFFNKLTNTKNDLINLDLLTSAQRVRFLVWAENNSFDIQSVGAQLGKIHTQSIASERYNLSKSAISVGIDLQEISELFPEGSQRPRDLKSDDTILKIFTSAEISYAEAQINPFETLTGIFSAKEALIKAGCIPNNVKCLKN